MAQTSFKRVFVSNSPTLLASGATVENLAVGQVGILDAKSYVATTAPTYAKNKALRLVWGTPDLGEQHLFSGVPNENEYTELIKGKLITDFKAIKAKHPKQEAVTIGWSGDTADTDTLSAKVGEPKHLFVKLTGGLIDKKFSLQGVTRKYAVQLGSVDPCGTGTECDLVDPRLIAADIAGQINDDKYINRFVKASVLTNSPASLTTHTLYKFQLVVCDTQDDIALGLVQAQYPSDVVKRIGIVGSQSLYQVIKSTNSAPSAYSNLGVTVVPDCTTCPTGYTLHTNGYVYKVKRADAGDATALTTVKSDYSIAATYESGSRVNYEGGVSTYIIVSDTKISSATGVDDLQFVSDARNTCVLTTPSTVAWAANGTLLTADKKFRLTVADDVCGNSRLADVQAAFPSLTVAQVAESSGTCVHTFETTVTSNQYEVGCAPDQIKFAIPQSFEGVQWIPVDAAAGDFTGVFAGIRIDVIASVYVSNEVTFDQWSYNTETVHVQASEFDPNYNDDPERIAAASWAVKKIQNYQAPVGFGANVRKLEKESKSSDLRERSFDPVVRDIEGYKFQADPNSFYDEYILTFQFKYKVGGWSDEYTDSIKLHVFFKEGNGASFESAINGYLASANINLDPQVL